MTKKQEQAAEAATTPEITGETEAKTEHKTPCVYCGPSVRGVQRCGHRPAGAYQCA